MATLYSDLQAMCTRIPSFDLLGRSMVKLPVFGRQLVPTHQSEILTASEMSAPHLTSSNGIWFLNSGLLCDSLKPDSQILFNRTNSKPWTLLLMARTS